MEKILSAALVLSFYCSFSQTTEIVIPANTQVSMILTEEVRESKVKQGQSVKFTVSEDVVVDGVTVIAKGATVHAVITELAKTGDMRIDLHSVTAVDGTAVKLIDCWIFTTRAQNLNSKGALVIKGTRKTCLTSVKTTIKNSPGRY